MKTNILTGLIWRRMLWTMGVHLAAGALWVAVYNFLPLMEWVRHTEISRMGVAMGLVLMILPATIVLFLWGGDHPHFWSKSTEWKREHPLPMKQKLRLVAVFLVNVAVSVGYAILINWIFTK